MYVMLYVMGEYSDTCLVFRAVDRQNFLETELKTVQASHKDLESFFKWLQEAETTVNVLADASQRENTAQDSACIRELRKQMQVRNYSCFFSMANVIKESYLEWGNLQPIGRCLKNSILEVRCVKEADFSS